VSGFQVVPGDLGENVTTADLNLNQLPLGTRLFIGNSAVVELTGLRTPCGLIDRFKKGLKRAMINKSGLPKFKCGVLGIVRAAGEIAPGDAVIVQLPSSSWEVLPAL
jgi:MOSC domain-containing protein YiiM